MLEIAEIHIVFLLRLDQKHENELINRNSSSESFKFKKNVFPYFLSLKQARVESKCKLQVET